MAWNLPAWIQSLIARRARSELQGKRDRKHQRPEIEHLEARLVLADDLLAATAHLAATADVSGPAALVRQEPGAYTFTAPSGAPPSGPIMDTFVGSLEMSAVPLNIATPVAATRIAGNLHVVGAHSGDPAEEIIDIISGSSSGVQIFQQLSSSQPFNVGLFEVEETPFGIIRIGQSNDGVSDTSATYWTAWNSPVLATANANESGALLDIAPNGTFVGSSDNVPVIGSPGTFTQPIVTAYPDIIAPWISDDGRFIITDGAMVQMVNGSPVEMNILSWDLLPDGTLPVGYHAIETNLATGRAIAVTDYFDVVAGGLRIAVYEAEPGSAEYGTLLFISEAYSTFQDLEVIDGQLILAINGPFDGTLYAMDGSFKTVTEITGTAGLFIRHGLFSGSLGMVLQDPNTGAAYATSYHTNDVGGGVATTVAVDWNGGNITDETLPLSSGVATSTHTFSAAAEYTIHATYLDASNQEVGGASFPVTVSAYRVDEATGEYVVGALETGGALKLTSTTTGWKFFLDGVLQNKQVAPGARVYGSEAADTMTVSVRTGETIQVYGNGGNDSITKTGAGTSYVFGGVGDDVISVAGGQNLLNGEAGMDTTLGKGARNVQIGGSEADTLEARATKTLLISGTSDLTIADANALFVELTNTTPSAAVFEGILAGKVVEDGVVDSVSVYNKGWLVVGAADTTYYQYPRRITHLDLGEPLAAFAAAGGEETDTGVGAVELWAVDVTMPPTATKKGSRFPRR